MVAVLFLFLWFSLLVSCVCFVFVCYCTILIYVKEHENNETKIKQTHIIYTERYIHTLTYTTVGDWDSCCVVKLIVC